MATASDADGKRSLFRRGLNATRLALAFAVAAVILTTVVYAFVVVSRKEELHVSVARGIIYVAPQPDPAMLDLKFSVQATNPSGRVRFYYTNIQAVVLLNGTNSTDSFGFAQFSLGQDDPNMDVAPGPGWMLQSDADAHVNYTDDMETRNSTLFANYFKQLRNDKSSSIISGAMLTLNGTLTVGLYSAYNKTGDKPTVYYCYPLTIGAATNASADAADNVQCQNEDPTK